MIKTLQNTLRQDKEQFTVPRSVLGHHPHPPHLADGIFQFGSKFSKCIRFSDINYAIASKEDKTAMFLNYSELLNALALAPPPRSPSTTSGSTAATLSGRS